MAATAWWAFTTRRVWKRWLNIAIAALAVANIVLGFLEFGYRQAAGALGLVIALALEGGEGDGAAGPEEAGHEDDHGRPLPPLVAAGRLAGLGELGRDRPALQRPLVPAAVEDGRVRRECATATGPDAVQALRDHSVRLFADLVRHRKRGLDLVYEAYHVDIGGES